MCACVVSTPALLLLLLLPKLSKVSEKGNAILNKRRRRKEPASGATDFVRNSSEISGTSLALCVCLRWVASREKATIRGTDIPVELFRRAKDQNVAEEKLVLKSSSKKRNLYRQKKCLCATQRERVCLCVSFGALSRCTHRSRIEGLEAESTTPGGLDNLCKLIPQARNH